MSSTFYDSPDDAKLAISIDVSCNTVWFFQHGPGSDAEYVRVHVDELPAIYEAMGRYLKEVE